MAKDIIGIDISDYSIEAVLLHKKGNDFEVSSYSRFRLSPDIVEDGNVLNKEKLKEAIRQTLFHAQPKRIEVKKVFLSIPESQVFTKVISIPEDIEEKNIKEAVKNKAQEVIPEDPDNLVPSLKIQPVKNGMREVFYSAAQLAVIKDMVTVFRELEMDILGVTTEAISSYMGLDDKYKDKTTLMLDLGNRTTIASVFDKNGIRDTINVNIAGENIIKALVSKMGISYNIAEEKMRDVGMVYSMENGEVMMIIQGQLQPLLDEIKLFIHYFQESSGQQIEKLILIGGLSYMKGIDSYFGENLSLDVSRGKSFVKDESMPNKASSTKYINALGLARFAFENPQINFYNDDFKKKIVDKKEEVEDKKKEGVDTKEVDNKKEINKNIEDNEGDTKILEEEDIFEEESRPFYKNKYIATVLILVALASIFIIFKDRVMNLIGQSDVTNITDTIVGQSKARFFEKEIIIGIDKNNTAPNYILAEEINNPQVNIYESEVYDAAALSLVWTQGRESIIGVPMPKQDPNTTTTQLFDEGNSYNIQNSVLTATLEDAAARASAMVNASFKKEGYYIIPEIVRSEVTNISSTEGDDVDLFYSQIESGHFFYAASEDRISNYLLSDISPQERVDLDNYKISNKNYTFLSKDEAGNFNYKVEFTYIKK